MAGKSILWRLRIHLCAATLLSASRFVPLAAHADALPQCQRQWGATDKPDCELTSTDQLGVRFEKRITGTTAEIGVVDASGAVVQTIIEHIENPARSGDSGVMMLRDVAGDGRDQLLLTLDSGSAHPNSHWALWRATTDSAKFTAVATGVPDDPMHDVGTFFGADIWSAGDGYIAEYGTGPTGSWLTQIYRFDESNKLFPVVSVQNDGTRFDGSPTPCHVQHDYNLTRVGLTANQARDLFCTNTEQHNARWHTHQQSCRSHDALSPT